MGHLHLGQVCVLDVSERAAAPPMDSWARLGQALQEMAADTEP